ncbi:hypothetical protein [Actinomadura sp. WMMB 499]|uniref:hypothetical protein n=1 Tax=Actinomadura sp. WMMB 499 TaxID=1219491 RepID=UPI001247EB19|nr:hypothetical protein [Actinomadura sp. WMMB 499]QFG24290.1 hypothetical protein F7P10_27320 [Actinomadura sp. WMMB 499]
MRTSLRSAAALLPVLALTAACQEQPENALRQIQPGTTVYIDGWDQDGDYGDRALVEQKYSKMWVIPQNAPFRYSRSGGFTVQVKLDARRGFVITDLGGVRVGRDHDYCLEEGETYAFMDVPANALSWEPTATDDTDVSSDDCVVGPDYD